MYYYDVAIGAQKHWDSAQFTYSYPDLLTAGQLVSVPFGKKNKTGIVMKQTTKPKFAVKELTPHDGIHIADEALAFSEWYEGYYAAKQGQVYTQMLPNYLTKKVQTATVETTNLKDSITLSSEQNRAKTELQDTTKPSVLHGVTGAGKTRIYISLILDALASGTSALLLYPEISLTPQLLDELRTYAPVAAFHSGQTNAERSRLWYLVATSTTPMVVIGPRSSLFLPFTRLGLIIIDEAHESTYKQDTDIRYNGILVAGGLAKAYGAKLILGSATPPVTETQLIMQSGGSLVCLHEQAIQTNHTKTITVVDKKNRAHFTRHSLLSNQLLQSITQSLDAGKQSLLFINRRGTAKLTLCEECGWQAECPDCELPLTYHHDLHKHICHTCGNASHAPSVCPDCTNATVLKSLGSKAIVDEVQKLFPAARIGRFDSDNTKGESLADVYNAVKGGSVDILIGTQQIAKGLDLPRLATVGVLDADLSLHFPDYSSDERTFQLISQVAGRVGRGHGDGEIVIQTLHPQNTTITHATTEDWHAFQAQELRTRKEHSFPPFVFGAKLLYREKKIDQAFAAAEKQKRVLLANSQLDISIDGPLPSFHHKHGGYYYVQLHLKSSRRSHILRAIHLLKGDGIYDIDPTTFL